MKVIVTGGCGFIGSHCVELFQSEGFEVVVIDNLSSGRRENLSHLKVQPRIVESDLSEAAGLWRSVISPEDWVIHLAALADIVPSIEHPEKYFQSNVVGTFNLVNECRKKKVSRFVYAASSSCYGLATDFPTSEDSPIQPAYPYALTKRLGEEIVMHAASVYGLPAISLRLFNVYGPRSRTSGTYGAMFGVFLAQKLADKPLTVVGDGTQTRDFIFVTDIARAFLAAAQSENVGEIYNVGCSKPVSVNHIVSLLQGSPVFIPKRPGEPDCTHADISKIQKQLQWRPQVSIEQGVQQLLEQIDHWKAAPVWDPESIANETSAWFQFLGNKNDASKNY